MIWCTTVILSLVLSILVHEGIHWLAAVATGYDPKINWYLFAPSVQYENKNNQWHNLCIACSAPLLLFLVGLFMQGESLFFFSLKVCFLSNIFNLMPITNDGEIILLSLYNIFVRKI